MKYKKEKITKFLQQSNFIEREYSNEALEDAEKAWKYAMKFKEGFINDRGISIDYVLNIHKHLLNRLNKRIAGKFKQCDVIIGGEIKRFISDGFSRDVMKEWLNTIDINEVKNWIDYKREEKVKEWHIGFEGLHPFEDGNGRTGRILLNITRLLLELPILIIHEGEEQLNYYSWFKK